MENKLAEIKTTKPEGTVFTETEKLAVTFKPEIDFMERVFGGWKKNAKIIYHVHKFLKENNIDIETIKKIGDHIDKLGLGSNKKLLKISNIHTFTQALNKISTIPDSESMNIDAENRFLVIAQRLSVGGSLAEFNKFFRNFQKYVNEIRENGDLLPVVDKEQEKLKPTYYQILHSWDTRANFIEPFKKIINENKNSASTLHSDFKEDLSPLKGVAHLTNNWSWEKLSAIDNQELEWYSIGFYTLALIKSGLSLEGVKEAINKIASFREIRPHHDFTVYTAEYFRKNYVFYK